MLNHTADPALNFSLEAMTPPRRPGRLVRAGTRYEVRLAGGSGRRVATTTRRDTAVAISATYAGSAVVEVSR